MPEVAVTKLHCASESRPDFLCTFSLSSVYVRRTEREREREAVHVIIPSIPSAPGEPVAFLGFAMPAVAPKYRH